MGNAHHHAKYPVGAGLNPTLHQPIWFSFSHSKSNSFAFSNHVSPPRPVSALKSGTYLKKNPAGQQMAAHTVTQQLCVNKSKARLSKPTHRRLHALPRNCGKTNWQLCSLPVYPHKQYKRCEERSLCTPSALKPPFPARPAPIPHYKLTSYSQRKNS
jgi:hypothetical protein